jgi:hypothetical protein
MDFEPDEFPMREALMAAGRSGQTWRSFSGAHQLESLMRMYVAGRATLPSGAAAGTTQLVLMHRLLWSVSISFAKLDIAAKSGSRTARVIRRTATRRKLAAHRTSAVREQLQGERPDLLLPGSSGASTMD